MYKLLLLILLLFSSISIDRGSKPVINNVLDDIIAEQVNLKNALTFKNIIDGMVRLNLKHIDILVAQIKVETGNLKHVYNNNLFGFRHNNYKSFNTWQDCLLYMEKWQTKKYKGGDYFKFLKDVNYAENPDYIEMVKRRIKK
jgi:hypothetical protein